jgi:hypothetical protein
VSTTLSPEPVAGDMIRGRIADGMKPVIGLDTLERDTARMVVESLPAYHKLARLFSGLSLADYEARAKQFGLEDRFEAEDLHTYAIDAAIDAVLFVHGRLAPVRNVEEAAEQAARLADEFVEAQS